MVGLKGFGFRVPSRDPERRSDSLEVNLRSATHAWALDPKEPESTSLGCNFRVYRLGFRV